jgi:AsmA family/AsmA-like C-terminal region
VNSFLLTLTAVLIVVLSALFAAPLFIDWNAYRPAFETQAANLLGRPVKVDGKVHLVLLPVPELRFDHVKVADQEGHLDKPFLEARSFEAWLNIGALLSGTIEARKIAIVDPILRLDVKAGGTGNWSDVGRRGVALPFAPKDVLLDEVSISGGRIEITKQGVPQIALEDVSGQASAQSLSGPYKVSATYSFNGRPQELRFSTSEPDAAGLFRIKSSLRDLDRNTTYLLDGGVSGFGATPLYDGTIVVRASNVVPGSEASEETQGDAQPADTARRDKSLLYELKGPLKATPERADISGFDLTVHAKSHPQIFKGNLTFDFAERLEAKGEFVASFVDLDAMFAAPGAEQRPSPAAVLYMFAEDMLDGAAEFGDGALTVTAEQAGLGGDLLSGIEVALAAKDGQVSIDRVKAVLPGANRIEASGRLSRGEFGPVFAGPVKLEGSGLRPLTRWAVGDRDMSGQASLGDFTVTANTTIGDGALVLADAEGELSGTKFRGALRLRGGERRLVELTLDSDRLDLRELIGEGPLLRSWLPSSTAAGAKPEETFLSQLRDDDMQVTLRVGELLLPNIPPGKLNLRFALERDRLDVAQLDFAAGSALALSGKGRIEQVSEAPAGRVDFALSAIDTGSLRVAAELFGFPEDVSRSKHLSALAPLDVHVSLIAARQGDATQAAIDLDGTAGGSDVSLLARALGNPAKPEAAKIAIDGSVTGERPQAFLVLLFPDLPVDRLAATGRSQGKLKVKLAGVPNAKIAGRASLETEALGLAFSGQGSLQESGLAFTGKGAMVSDDAAIALMLMGFETPPSAAGVPLQFRFDIAKQGAAVDLKAMTGRVAGENVSGAAHFDLAGAKTRFALSGSATTVSLPSLLGVLVAWQHSPSTEEMLGTIGAGASEFWPSRGFSLGPIETAEGSIALKADTLSLGSAVKVSDAALHASVGKDGLSITDLKGHLFGGELAASGKLSPRGNGAELQAQAEVKGGKLEDLAKSVTGSALAKGPFDLALSVQGEGLSPPGLVAGLSGEGTLALGPGALHALSPDPLRRVAATAAKKTIHADKEEIAAEAKTVRETITKGTYKFAPVKFPFEVKNGTLRFAPTVLSGTGAETKVNFYLELASLKLDSEWAVSLADGAGKDVPPVSLVFTGALNKARDISPSVDTGAIEAYLTMRRMQEDVERLETLDVSGREPAPAEEEHTSAVLPLEPEPQTDLPAGEAEPVQPMAAAEPEPMPHLAQPEKLPSATELLGPVEEEFEIITALPPMPSEIPAQPPVQPETSAALPEASDEAEPLHETAPVVEPAPAPAAAPPPEPAPPPETATTPQAAPPAAAAEAVEPVQPPAKPQKRRRTQTPREPADAWKKGISIFGGG